MPYDELRRLRTAIEVGTRAAAFWRAIRDPASGDLVDLELIEANEATAEYFDWELERLRGARYSEIVPEGMVERIALIGDAIERDEALQFVVERTTGTGYSSTFEIRIAPCGEDEIFSAIWDVGERERQIRELEHARLAAEDAKAMMEVALDLSDDPIAVYQLERDAAGSVVDARLLLMNDPAIGEDDARPEDLIGMTMHEMIDAASAAQFIRLFDEAASAGRTRESVILIEASVRQAGPVSCRVAPFGVDRVALTWRHVAEEGIQRRSARAIPLRERRDALTGLPTREDFRITLRDRIATLDPDRSWYVVTIDIDSFGLFNDLVGELRSDMALVRIAQSLPGIDPSISLVGRTGSDEFSLLLGVRGAFDAEGFSRRLGGLLSLIDTGRPGVTLRASAGARQIEPELSVDRLMRDCDTALRYAVANGGGRLEVYSDGIRRELLTVEIMAEELYRGIAEQEFIVLYQPICRLSDRSVVGHEALARWTHPSLGELMPPAFIPLAESSGAIVHLGRHLLDCAVKKLEGDGALSVNVSVVQLMAPALVDHVASVLARSGMAPERLVLEVTESAALEESRRIRDHIRALRDLGVRFAIDDFGAGYSSIRHLDRLTVDYVKLDAGLIRGEMTPARIGVLNASIDMIRAIGAEALIEGIESEQQLDLAAASGAVYGQGYLFGRPALSLVG